MTLAKRLAERASRVPPHDPQEVLAAARAQVESPPSRSTRHLSVAAAVVGVLALVAGAFALADGDGDSNSDETVRVAGPDSATTTVQGDWLLVGTVHNGQRQPAQGDATVVIAGNTLTGTDGCGNAIKARIVDGHLAYDGQHTQFGCPGDEANDDADHFWQVVQRAPNYEVRDGELWLLTEERQGLIFAAPDEGEGTGPDPAPSATVSVAGIPPAVNVSTSSLTTVEHAWLEHTISLENTGSEPVYLQDFRAGTVLGNREVAVATEGCGPGWSSGEPVAMGCYSDYRPVSIAPGEAHIFTVTLWRELAGMSSVTGNRFAWELVVETRDAPFDEPDDTGTAATITITYENLNAAYAPG